MDETTMRPGTIEHAGDSMEIRLERSVEHDPATVWRALTESATLVNWLAPGTIEPRAGGAVRLDFEESGATIDSTVRAFEPPRRLVYSWSSGDGPERPLHWELEPLESGTRLQLTLRLPAEEDAAKAAAGWDAHLEMLLAALEGVPIRFPVDHFLAARRLYGERLPAPGEQPGAAVSS